MGKALLTLAPAVLYHMVGRGMLLPEEFQIVGVLSPTDIYTVEPYHEVFHLLVESPGITNVGLSPSSLPELTPLYQQSFDEQGREQITLVKLTCHRNNKEVILFPTS